MKKFFVIFLLAGAVFASGCETVKEGAKAGGTVIGKGADAIGGITEGAAEGYKDEDVTANNPYGR